MKAYIGVLLFSVVVTLVAACGGEEPKPAESSPTLAPPAASSPILTAPADTTLCPMSPGTTTPFGDALVFIEFNSTDEDVGFHATFDAPGWNEAVICGPDNIKIFEVKVGGNIRVFLPSNVKSILT